MLIFNLQLQIAIAITDTNNKIPRAETDMFPSEERIYENAPNGTKITTIIASDQDRDRKCAYITRYLSIPKKNVVGLDTYVLNYGTKDKETEAVPDSAPVELKSHKIL